MKQFISYLKKKKAPNVTYLYLVTTNMPKGRGRKGSVPPRKRKQNRDDETCTRVPMTVTQSIESNTQSISVGATFQDKSSPSYHFTSIAPYPSYPYCPSGPSIPSGSSTPSYPYCPSGSSTPSGPSTPSYPHCPSGSSTPSYPYCPSGSSTPSGPSTPSYPYCPSGLSTLYCPPSPYFSPYPRCTSTPYGPPHSSGAPWTVTFIKGNIKVCFGCKNQYEKNLKPPNDICIEHQEWGEFIPTGSRTSQKKFSNVYYHCNPQCVWLRWGSFNPSSIILSDIASELTEVHREHLLTNFGV